MYINNNFTEYFKRTYRHKKDEIGHRINQQWKWVVAPLAFIAAVFQLAGIILKDASIEIIFILVFGKVVLSMAQGRDMIVSMFEPGGLYGAARIFLTILALVAFSISMWIIPAYLFELRKKFAAANSRVIDPFKKHLFFAHRIIPLVPFWFMAYGLFNEHGWIFILLAIGEIAALSLISSPTHSKKVSNIIFVVVLTVLLIFLLFFIREFQVKYFMVKVLLAIILYLLSILLFMIYNAIDKKLLDEHFNGSKHLAAIKRYPYNTKFYIACIVAHIVLVTLFITQSFNLAIAPESMLLYVFALYVFFIDLVLYIIRLRPLFKTLATLFLVITAICVFTGFRSFNTYQYRVDRIPIPKELYAHRPLSIDDYYKQWKEKLKDFPLTDTFPIILIAGEGGGSRAGFWFSQNLIDFDLETKGNFRDHVFSISTVSGSTVGLGTYFAYLDQTAAARKDGRAIADTFLYLPEEIYKTNFVGSSISGLFIVDLFHALLPGKPTLDRNNVLMQQESKATCNAISKITGTKICETALDQEYMSVFYDKDSGYKTFRKDHPLALINTTRSNDGRRGIFAPIKLDSSIFNDAIDINSYLYKDSLWSKLNDNKKVFNKQGIKFGTACVASELFPILSAPVYIDSLGSFVDGGYHENSGLKTTLDVYNKLIQLIRNDPQMKGRQYKIYIMYLKNGGETTDLYSPQPSVLPILQPLSTLMGQPFNGSASWFEKRANYIADTTNRSEFIKIALDKHLLKDTADLSDTEKEIMNDLMVKINKKRGDTIYTYKDSVLNFPLARWLSNSVIKQMKKTQTRIKEDPTKKIDSLLYYIRKAHKIL